MKTFILLSIIITITIATSPSTFPKWMLDFENDRFQWSNGESYFASGYMKTRPNNTVAVSFAINPNENKFFIDLGTSKYYMNATHSFITILQNCYHVANFTYFDQINGYTEATHTSDGKIDHVANNVRFYTGHSIDIGGCGRLAVTMGLNRLDRVVHWGFQQFFPKPQGMILVGGPIFFTNFRTIYNQDLFTIPNHCEITTNEFCENFFPNGICNL